MEVEVMVVLQECEQVVSWYMRFIHYAGFVRVPRPG